MKTYREALDEMAGNPGYHNPYRAMTPTYQRRDEHAKVFYDIQNEIERLFYPQFISYPEDAETIEAIIRLTMSKRILEVGMFTGFSTLHMIRAVYGDGLVVAIDNQQVYTDFFKRPDIAPYFQFVKGQSPDVLNTFRGQQPFDFVYIDSDHGLDHTRAELAALMEITRPGSVFMFHDCGPTNPVHLMLYDYVRNNIFRGLILPSAQRLDLGPNCPREALPHLGIFIRT